MSGEIDRYWFEFATKVLPVDLPGEQLDVGRAAYFAGWLASLASLENCTWASPLPMQAVWKRAHAEAKTAVEVELKRMQVGGERALKGGGS